MVFARCIPVVVSAIYLARCAEGGTFWQITDLHVDGMYSARGSVASSCHSNDSTGTREEWFGRNGCGLPWITVQSGIEFMARIDPQPDFIVWTGDTAPYWSYPDWTHVFPKLERALNMLREKFPNTPIYPTIGNHDAFPSDQFPIDNNTFYGEYLRRSGWSKTLSETAQATFNRGGYYMAEPVAGVKIIVLNTNIYYPKNTLFSVSDFSSDPTGQLSWLESTLNRLEEEESTSNVLIVAHIPPGFAHWNAERTGIEEQVNTKLLEILSSQPRQLDMRLGHVFGHEHLDTFKVASSPRGQANETMAFFISPAVYPGSGDVSIKPGVRLYKYNGRTLQDYDQYNFDLKQANRLHRKAMSVVGSDFWRHSYQASQLYNIPDLSGETMRKLLNKFRKKDRLFDRYMAMTNGRYGKIDCDESCKQKRLCIMGSKNSREMERCQSGSGQASLGVSMFVTSLILLNYFASF